MREFLTYSKEVEEGMAAGKAIVALESTIISHGMPYPQNVEMARKVEQIIRDNGAVPATIAIMDGKIKIGLSEEELETLGTSKNARKTSRRDLAYVVASKEIGATTVASTMICAELAGIKVFVTGGIGGVHRGAEETMDISADLEELASTNVAVVCAGVKSILDIGLTLEYLETKGVPVVGFQTDKFPAFYTATSEFDSNFRLDEPIQVARMLKVKWDLGLIGGAIIANPIPAEDSLAEEYIDSIITTALNEATENGVKGKDVTPFLLGKVKELTEGKSLESNIALVYNNATVGAKIAVELNNL
ncbi:pseudouridine-5'-phosphate glycosidase [Psychrobacillus insolitus]|uniref:Pseudouridine-5'-phosphate glycosidase n=1 Tax=Psychrobacillus insolitus TaxID=1461 RepID=A0A2W7MCW9_9BACI|nr:pseudouridine-5'-phosphate glycosidase [Psychrobacillus insolitus]PZX03082.1 pseudouridine-5'-phosphate glycosidase [Psychrobacillus insolitus]